MAKPILPWSVKNKDLAGVLLEAKYPKLVFRSVLDKRYILEVQRTGKSAANLLVFDHKRKDKQIACWKVGLSYGALLGPDVNDIELWCTKVLDFVDEVYGKRQKSRFAERAKNKK